jgi:hypothetical protein
VAASLKPAKREDSLPLERAVRALEDVHRSLNEFSTTDSVTTSGAFAAVLKRFRHKAKKLRKRVNALAVLWDHSFGADP